MDWTSGVETILGAAGLLLVGAITPGPNNLVVLRTASRRGFPGAIPAASGVVLGGLVLLALAMTGLDALFVFAPRWRIALTAAGCIYLVWLGIGLILNPHTDNRIGTGPDRKLPQGCIGLFLFQFTNLKGWVLMATAAASIPASPVVGVYLQIATLFAFISLACLSLWAALGQLFATILTGRMSARWFERSMGCLLIGSAALLLFGK